MNPVWRRATLGELEIENAGVIQTGPFGSQLHASDYSPGGTPVIMPTNIRDLRIDPTDIARVSQEHVERLSRHVLREGDVVYSRRGDVEKCALITDREAGWLCGTGCLLVRVQGTSVDPRFLSYALSLLETRAWISGHAVGATMPNLNTEILREVPVVLPEIEEQRGIAATLGALDDKIASDRRLVDFSSDLLDAIAAQVSSDLPPLPLGGLVEQPRDSVNPARLGDAIVEHFSLPAFDAGAIPERVQASTILSSKLLLVRRSILVGRLNPRFNRTWWVTPDAALPALASPEFLCLQAVDDESLAALWLAVRTDAFRAELAHRVTGTSGSHQRVRPEDAVAIEVPDVGRLPRETKARALALLKAMEQKRQESERLAALRDALLPELLSGRIRVPDAAEAVADGTT